MLRSLLSGASLGLNFLILFQNLCWHACFIFNFSFPLSNHWGLNEINIFLFIFLLALILQLLFTILFFLGLCIFRLIRLGLSFVRFFQFHWLRQKFFLELKYELITSFLNLNDSPRLWNPIKSQLFAVSNVVTNEFPISITIFEKTQSANFIFNLRKWS